MGRDHGGNLDWAMDRFGGRPEDWIDLSTGINRMPWPIPDLPQRAWTALPTRADMARLADAARAAYGTGASVVPLAGAQAAIQIIPRMIRPGLARILSPTYNEHAAALAAAGWRVEEVADIAALNGADLAVVVNPNNPDGRSLSSDALMAIADAVDTLIVDESFADARPDLSVAAMAGRRRGLFVLRSFGKFYGLAGLRLGFALGHPEDIAIVSEMTGPWPVSGAAIEIGAGALADRGWKDRTAVRLREDAGRADGLAQAAGWRTIGGTELFRLYDTDDAQAAQKRLARSHIWSRIFPYSDGWLRLGLPGSEAEWDRLGRALAG